VWDTSLAVNALIESGLPAVHPQLVRAGEWMMDKQITVPGDWQAKRPHVAPGGWPFQYDNDFYPDLDDSAMVMMALAKTRGLDAERKARCMDRGLTWFLGMQGGDGGWGSFDADNDKLIFNNIPFADHGALLDPSTEDLTGRGLGWVGHPWLRPITRGPVGAGFVRKSQHASGPGTAAGASTTPMAPGRSCAGWVRSARTVRGITCSGRSPGRRAAERRRRPGRDARSALTRIWPVAVNLRARRPGRLAPPPGASRPAVRWASAI
jgi:hypothetical protein